MPSPHPAIRTLIQHRDRVEEVLRVLTHHGVAHMVALSDHSHLREFVPAGVRLRGDALSDGERLREALIELGPTFIKLGQVLSTRIDLVGPDVAADLRELQTNAGRRRGDGARDAGGRPGPPGGGGVRRVRLPPLASASVAQAHVARLHDGTEVVVKVQHAGIRDVIRADFDILEALAAVVEEHDETVALYRPRGVLKQLRRTVEAELDLRREARCSTRCARTSPPSRTSSSRGPTRSLRAARADDEPHPRPPAARRRRRPRHRPRGVRAPRRADLRRDDPRDQLFHADPHPGNVLVEATEHGIRYGILDWGEVGRIDQLLEDKLGAFILAVGGGDHLDVADRLLDIVTAPAHLDLDAFRIDLSDWLDTHGAAGIEHLDVAAAVEDLTRIVREHRLRMPPDVAMLGKTVIQLQGTSPSPAPASRSGRRCAGPSATSCAAACRPSGCCAARAGPATTGTGCSSRRRATSRRSCPRCGWASSTSPSASTRSTAT